VWYDFERAKELSGIHFQIKGHMNYIFYKKIIKPGNEAIIFGGVLNYVQEAD